VSLSESLIDLYQTFFLLKKEANFGIEEMYNLYPYELELYYFMTLAELKREAEREANRAK